MSYLCRSALGEGYRAPGFSASGEKSESQGARSATCFLPGNPGRRRRAGYDNRLRSVENCALAQLSWPNAAAALVCAVVHVSPFSITFAQLRNDQ